MAHMMDVNKYPNPSHFSPSTLFGHAKNHLDEKMYDLCLIKRQINVLRESSRSVSAIALQKSCGLSSRVVV